MAKTIPSHNYDVTVSTAGMPLSPEVILGKHVWERHSCINCHTLHGEGSCFAPELGNVMTRWGVLDDPETAFEALDGWMASQTSGIEGRRQMPLLQITPEEMRALSEFLRWADQTDTQGWPRTDAGQEKDMKYQSQRVTYAYFMVAMGLFGVQVLGGLLAGWVDISPNFLSEVLPFNFIRMIHTNALIVWLLLGFFGAAYFLVPAESEREIWSVKLA